MDKLIYLYSCMCFLTIHLTLTLVASEDSPAEDLSLPILGDFKPQQTQITNLSEEVWPKQNENSRNEFISNNGVQQLQSTLNDSLKDGNNGAVASDKPSSLNTDVQRIPSVVIDSESDTNVNGNKQNDPLEGQPHNAAPVAILKSEDAQAEDTSNKDEDDWFNQEPDSKGYYDADENKDINKDEESTDQAVHKGGDDDDEEYDVAKWTHSDDENDTVWEAGSEDDDQDDFDEGRSHLIEDVVDEELAKRNRPPTAPTSMVLFYTWMIVAVLIFVVGISMYQSRCKGIRLSRTRSASAGSDRKRLLDHEFV